MPIEFLTSVELNLVYRRWSGRVTAQEVLDNLARYVTDHHYHPGRSELNDLSRVEEMDFSFNEMRGLVRRADLIDPDRHLQTHAVFWAPGDTAFSAARMYQQLVDFQNGRAPEIYRLEHQALAAYRRSETSIDALLENHTFHPAVPRRSTGFDAGA